MKKRTLMAALLCCTIMMSSCIGSFRLTNKVLSWNHNLGGKFVNELFFFVLGAPVYGFTVFADCLVFNSVEFWSGRNPIADAGKVQRVTGENGDVYLVENTGDGYRMLNETKNVELNLKFDEATQTWSVVSDGNQTDIVTFIEDNRATVHLPDGSTMDIDLSEIGLAELRQMVAGDALMFAEL